jgi:hypothetical protein
VRGGLVGGGAEPALGGSGSGLGGYPGVAGSAERGEVLEVKDGAAASPSLDLVDVDGGGGVASFADRSLLEEVADEGYALLAVERGTLD